MSLNVRRVLLVKPRYSCGFWPNLFEPVHISLIKKMPELASEATTLKPDWYEIPREQTACGVGHGKMSALKSPQNTGFFYLDCCKSVKDSFMHGAVSD